MGLWYQDLGLGYEDVESEYEGLVLGYEGLGLGCEDLQAFRAQRMYIHGLVWLGVGVTPLAPTRLRS